MIRKSSILITGAGGEVGSELIKLLSNHNKMNLVTLDLHPIKNENSCLIDDQITGNILDVNLLDQINAEYEIKEIYHLAAILSTRSELSPRIAHDININGTVNLLELAINQTTTQKKPVKFFFPSSIAVYGVNNHNHIYLENESLNPITMYGCNKLYAEKLGLYYSQYYNQLSDNTNLVDFRSIRFPGLISASTIPSGGTSDFIPEMWHNLKINNKYESFVNEDTRIPFLAMPDAIQAINELMKADIQNITSRVYNITSFNPSVSEFFNLIKENFNNPIISYNINKIRQRIVNSWPNDIDDSLAKNEWGWEPMFNLEETISKYLSSSIMNK